MAYTPASRTAGGLSLPSCPAAVANRSFSVRVRCSASVLSSCMRCSVSVLSSCSRCCANDSLVSRLVARRPKYCVTTVAVTVRTPTPAAMIAAVTSGLMSGTYYTLPRPKLRRL